MFCISAVSCSSNQPASAEHNSQRAQLAIAAQMKHTLLAAGHCSQEGRDHLFGLLLLHGVSSGFCLIRHRSTSTQGSGVYNRSVD
jgi:hypothetical protein